MLTLPHPLGGTVQVAYVSNTYLYFVTVAYCFKTIEMLKHNLCEVTGMKAFTTTPQAGAHGEMLGVM